MSGAGNRRIEVDYHFDARGQHNRHQSVAI